MLSPNEIKVLVDAASGMTATETAWHRYKAVSTIRTQRKSACKKLSARTITQAVAIAIRQEIIP